MRKAIGFIIVLWAVSQFAPRIIPAAERATVESLRTVEFAAVAAQESIVETTQ